MPRTRSLAWAELKIGIVTLFALFMTALLIFAVGGTGGFFWQNYSLKVVFDNVAGLKEGSPVRVAGVEVGSVSKVQLFGRNVEVWFEVTNNMKPLVTTKSIASIGSISLLGEGSVDITAAPEGTSVPPWGYVTAGTAEGSIAHLTQVATNGHNEAGKLVADLRAGKGTVGKLFTDDAVYQDLDEFVRSAERVAKQLADGKGTLGKLTSDPRVYNDLQKSIDNLNTITGRIRNGEGSLGHLLTDQTFSKSLTSTTQKLDSISGRLDRGEGTAGKLLTDEALYKRLDSVTGRLDSLIAQLNAGEGTAGQLLHDKQLYENMNQAATDLRGLIREITKDPKKYLNVKVSIF